MKRKTTIVLTLTVAVNLFSTAAMGAEVSEETVTGYGVYDEVIQSYITGIEDQWGPELFLKKGLCCLAGYHTDLSEVGYYLKDLDQDGVEELLIGEVDSEYDTGMIYELYTVKDDRLKQVTVSSERDRYYLCTDSTIANEGSNSAMDSLVAYYDLEDDRLLPKEAVLYDAYQDELAPWFYSTRTPWKDTADPITEEEAESVQENYEYEEISFTPLSDFYSVVGNE